MVLPEKDDSESSNEAGVHSLSSASAGSGRLPKPSAKDADNKMRNKIIHKEEINVRNARFFVIAAGIACAVAVGAAINIFARQNEQNSFELEVRKSVRRRNHPYLLASRKRHH
jgi:protein required for attachment to host cells